ncbi:MAG: type I-F CRISPR-associated protein Csy2 [Psychrobacter glacincola]
MSNFLLIDHIDVQGANTVAGFTWGFPAITHFLGFVHLLQRKIYQHADFHAIKLAGCAVIAHDQQTSTYRSGSTIAFTQSRNPPYLASHAKDSPPPIIEEGKMSMTVSLLIEVEDSVKQYGQVFVDWVQQQSYLQRLAGGSIFNIVGVTGFAINNDEDKASLRALQRKLLPGFALINRSNLLDDYFESMQTDNPSTEIFDAWIDFVALKRQARPAYDLIDRHLVGLLKDQDSDNAILIAEWKHHLEKSYNPKELPDNLLNYFSHLVADKSNKNLINQWQQYVEPTERTTAKWEYAPKPARGYLVPIMCGYKAISEVLNNDEVTGTRDNATEVCFVEAVHSIGEWQSVHRWKNLDDVSNSFWQYNYSPDWYLCSNHHSSEKSDSAAKDDVDALLIQDPNSL